MKEEGFDHLVELIYELVTLVTGIPAAREPG